MEEVRVTIVTPEGVIFEGNVKNITLPGSEGEFCVYPNHCSLLSLLKSGVIEVVGKEKEYVAIDWGYARVEKDCVDILANGAVAIGNGGEISKNLDKAKELFKKASADDVFISTTMSKLDYLTRR